MEIKTNKIENVTFINIKNDKNLEIILSTFGASIYELKIDNESLVMVPKDLHDFYYDDGYYGKIVGRFAGRIDDASCKINDVTYILDKNWNGINALHGGNDGISFKNFDYEIVKKEDKIDIIFRYLEKENKLPGNIKYEITYSVYKNRNDINLHLKANTDKDTICNLTNHSYFNLSGDCKDTILNHELYLNCPKYTNLNNNLITKSIDNVNKIMDFTTSHKIGDFINDDSLQKHTSYGYDHCFIKEDNKNDLIAILKYKNRKLEIRTNYPSIVCYTTNYPKEIDFNVKGNKISRFQAIAMECQYIPNGINMNENDISILRKDQTFDKYINYSFK